MADKTNIYVGNDLNYIVERVHINCYKLYIHSIVGDVLVGIFKNINEVENEINYRCRKYSQQMQLERARRQRARKHIIYN